MGESLKKTIQVRVNTLPVIQAQNQVIQIGETFNPLDWATAYDAEDNQLDLNESNIFKNNVNPKIPGIYEVVYGVADSDGGVVEKTIQVRVNAKPVIEAQDQILFIGETFNPLDFIKAYDDEDGEFSPSQIQILKNEVNHMIPGVYEVVYQITDQDGAMFQKTIKVVIKDQPIIEDIEPDEEVETPDEEVEVPDKEEDLPNEEVERPDQEMIDTGFSRATSLMLGVSSLFVGVWHLRRKKN